MVRPDGAEAGHVDGILALLAERRGVDFRDYRRDTLINGIDARRSAKHCSDLEAYLNLIERDEEELEHLLGSVVVPVSEFHRDAEVFHALRTIVIPELFDAATRTVRFWSAGCATGEEAWTIAMLCDEIAPNHPGVSFEVIASDVDARSIRTAQAAVYDADAVSSMPSDLRDRYLELDGDRYVVTSSLREHVHFEEHNVMGTRLAPKRAVVAHFDLVLMRNVLIYFDRRLQEKALARLASIVRAGGVLVLGLVETVPHQLSTRLVPHPSVDQILRIFQRRIAA